MTNMKIKSNPEEPQKTFFEKQESNKIFNQYQKPMFDY